MRTTTKKRAAARGMGSVYLRGKRWWIKYYREGLPIREPSKSENRQDAIDLLKQRLGESVTGKYIDVPASRILMEGLFQMVEDDYIRYEKRDLYQVKRRIRQHLKPALGNIKAVSFGTDQIDAYITRRKRQGAGNATINRELSIIRRSFSLGAQAHPPKVHHTPPVVKLPEDNIRTGFLEQEQYEALKPHVERALTPLVIGYALGLRSSCILLLEWSMVDLKNKELRIPPRLAKNKSGQVCPLYGELLEHLTAARAVTPKACKWVCHENDKRIKSFKGEWEKAVDAAGLSGLLFHDLRRSAVRNMVRAGIPEVVARAISGHKTRSIFDRYNITSGKDLKDAGDLLERAQKRKKTGTEDTE